MTATLDSLDNLYSSYAENDYKRLFYALARIHKPKVCVELGVLEGYSLCATAMALRDNGGGIIHGYDLWEKYPHRAVSQEVAQENVDSLGLTDYVRLHFASAKNIPERWPELSVSWVHVDISNDGVKANWALAYWQHKLIAGGNLLLEGGSEERDQVEWMIKFDKPPIAPVLRDWDDVYEIFTFQPSPSLTICQKARIA